MDTQSPSSGSRSIIKVKCAENADPAQNRLELRTDPPTYIYLQPGLNILPVELYPGLCYGFSPAPDEDGELGVDKNCSDILEFDLSDFDASHLPSMDHMFGWMKRVQRITFGKMATPMLENTEGAFYRTGDDGKMEMLDLSRMDFSKVTNADWMFHGIKTSGVNLTNADFSNLTQAEGMFDECEIDHLILDNAKFPTEMLEDIFIDLARYFDIKKISLKGWGKAEIKVAIESIENNLDNTDPAASGIQYELDHDLEYSLVKTNEGVVTSVIDTKNTSSGSKSFIRIRCAENADPTQNRLQLRTDPATYIYLQPGLNILSVEQYPALRFGFSQVQDENGDFVQSNGQQIQEFDFSNFDGSYLSSMSYMFAWMRRVKKITFGNMNTSMLEKTDHAFHHTGNDITIDVLDLSGLNFSKVSNASWMFHGIKVGELNLTNIDFSNVKEIGLILDMCVVDTLILDRAKFPSRLPLHVFDDFARWSKIRTLSLKGWKTDDLKLVIQTINMWNRGIEYIYDGQPYTSLTPNSTHQIKSLPICGTIPARYTTVVEEQISIVPELADLWNEIRSPQREVEVQTFPPLQNNLDEVVFLARPTEDPISLQEFYHKVTGSPSNAHLALVIHNKNRNSYRLWNTEVIFRLDYNWDKDFLEFYSTYLSKSSLIEWSQLADAIFEDTIGHVFMLSKYHERLMIVDSDTPIFLNSTSGLKKISNVVSFSGYTRSLDEPQEYIGLVIEENF